MALVKCKECGNDVASSAPACPKCGAPVPPPPGATKRVAQGVGIGCGGLIVLLVAIGFIASKTSSSSTSYTPVPVEPARTLRPDEVPGNAEEPAATAVDLAAMLAEYKDNELRADGRYKGRVVLASGIVDDVKKDILGSPYITVGTGKAFEIPTLQCSLAKDQVERASALSKGEKVSIEGKVKGLMMNVQADDCRIR